jgi:hypothetical protein
MVESFGTEICRVSRQFRMQKHHVQFTGLTIANKSILRQIIYTQHDPEVFEL